ncbi:MAG TPA: serine/threonine-protein kinase [Myxococcota bacterium]
MTDASDTVDSAIEGTGFGRYELLQLLAVGGMAEIFLARTRLGGMSRSCVIKRILPEYSTSRPFVSMFIDEARITIGLEHEHIVKLLDFGQVDGTYFMAIEYVDGCDLVDVLRAVKAREIGVEPLAAAYIARAMAKGLHAAHDAVDHKGQPMHVVHRDVSPHNVFLSWRGAVKIGDFGIASADNKLRGKTTPGTIKGKYGYMSPEQTLAAKVDRRADVWACGVVLWEMLVGGRLFAAENPVDTVSRVNEMEVLAPSSLRADVPAALDAIVLGALTRPLSLRTPDCGSLVAALDDVIGVGDDARFGPADLEAWLPRIGLSRAVMTSARVRGRSVVAQRRPTASSMPAVSLTPGDATLRALHEALVRERRLWTLVEIGERHMAIGERPQALAAIRVAAAVLAHRGLLVQAICAIHALRPLVDAGSFDADLELLSRLRGHDRAVLVSSLSRPEEQAFLQTLRGADPGGLGDDATEQTISHDVTPLFGAVAAADFVRLARVCRIEKKPRGAVIVREGERSDALYAVGHGRVVVGTAVGSATDGERIDGAGRVMLAALTEGDFFGEFSFLTQSPRSATVEADSDVVVLRLDRAAVDGLISADSAFKAPLREFYKERVAELLLAKNPVIGALPADVRRALIKDAEVRDFVDGDTIVREGDDATELFFILAGEVEVHRDEQGIPVFINKLHEGQFFGEMAALQHRPRTATVQAMGPVEVLCIARTDIEAALDAAAEVRRLFERAMVARAVESEERVVETARIFAGV